MLTLTSGASFIHMSEYAEFSWAVLGRGTPDGVCHRQVQQQSGGVLALSGGLALAPPLISSVAFTKGTSWSSSRNTLKPFSRTTCRLRAELRVLLM